MKQRFSWESSRLGAALASSDCSNTDYLESLDVPAVLIASDHTVLDSSSGFSALLAKSRDEIHGKRIGEVLDCTYATTPGPCGETDACFMCGFRRFIGLTLLTGEKLPEFEIGLNHKSGSRRFTIRTEKFNKVVLLALQETRGQ